MKKIIPSHFILGALALFALSIAGCEGESFNTVPVSGIVSLDGEPLAGVKVVFLPQPTESTAVVGPFSSATTDANGKFELKTRYDEPGAVVGTHRVTFAYRDIDRKAITGAEPAAEAEGDGDSSTANESAGAKSQLGKRKPIPRQYGEEESNVKIEVPAGGMDNANFELKSN